VRGLNWLMMNTLGRATQSKNDEGESTGILNRVTAYIYRYKMFLRRVKSANRPLYHTAKYAFLLGLVYLILLRRFFELP
jgi:aspartyl/asparaginyl beta-hydroxylase (cupin superfamily)